MECLLLRAQVDGATPLMRAAESGGLMITELLISRGANVNHVNTAGQSVLHVALHHNHLRVAKCVQPRRHVCATTRVHWPWRVRTGPGVCRWPNACCRRTDLCHGCTRADTAVLLPFRRHLLRAGGRKCPGKCLKCNLNLKMLERQAAKKEAARSAAAGDGAAEPQVRYAVQVTMTRRVELDASATVNP